MSSDLHLTPVTRAEARDFIAIDRAVDDEGWVHASCSEAPHDDREPCPTCWLTICDCKDERC